MTPKNEHCLSDELQFSLKEGSCKPCSRQHVPVFPSIHTWKTRLFLSADEDVADPGRIAAELSEGRCTEEIITFFHQSFICKFCQVAALTMLQIVLLPLTFIQSDCQKINAVDALLISKGHFSSIPPQTPLRAAGEACGEAIPSPVLQRTQRAFSADTAYTN